ncbi:MAG TPA: hypothetical protein VIU61_28285 [Kofleriaceae bacterium]
MAAPKRRSAKAKTRAKATAQTKAKAKSRTKAKAKAKPKAKARSKATAKAPVKAKAPTKTKAKTKPKTKTGHQRLNAVFADLNARGIVALQNAGYTMSEGWEDVNEIAAQIRDRTGKAPRGATFYHGQDRERLWRGEGTHLAYGSYATGKRHVPESLALAHEIVEVLKAHGFKAKWDGTIDERVHTGKFVF